MKLRPPAAFAALAAAFVLPAGALAQDPAPADPSQPPVAAAAGGQGQGQGGQGQGQDPGGDPQPGPKPLQMKLKVKGLKNGKAKVGKRVTVVGMVRPFVGHQRVEIRLANRGRTVAKANKFVRQVKGKNVGRFKLRSKPLIKPGSYRARASKPGTALQAGGTAKSKKFKLRYVDLDPGDRGPAVELFNRLLRKQGYYNTDKRRYGSHTERAVMAFRKVNGMARKWNATPGIFKALAAGKGEFKLRRPKTGKHVEVDISRQVMALAVKGKAKYVFHVSTGAAATPSDPGGFRFYRKDPGYNAIGMYYSVYYNRGEAVHGYKSVPPYPASHGCIRNPIPDSKFIYNWISLGDRIFVYH